MQVYPDWEQEPARTCEHLSVVEVQASGKFTIPGHSNAANPLTKHNRLNS